MSANEDDSHDSNWNSKYMKYVKIFVGALMATSMLLVKTFRARYVKMFDFIDLLTVILI